MTKLKDISEWDIDYLLRIQPDDEEDWFERKGKQLLDSVSDFRNELAKQVSAFANTLTGYVVLGLSADGKPDGGLPTAHKNGLKEWLEQIIPTLTDGPVFNAQVRLLTEGQGINEGCAVVVIHIPVSDTVHQHSQDKKYYGRSGAHSLPLSHTMIMALASRRKWPKMEVSGITHEFDEYSSDASSSGFDVPVTLVIDNTGNLLCRWLGIQMAIPKAFTLGKTVADLKNKKWNCQHGDGYLVCNKKEEAIIFPGTHVYEHFQFVIPKAIAGGSGSWNDEIQVTVYADNAPKTHFQMKVGEIPDYQGRSLAFVADLALHRRR